MSVRRVGLWLWHHSFVVVSVVGATVITVLGAALAIEKEDVTRLSLPAIGWMSLGVYLVLSKLRRGRKR